MRRPVSRQGSMADVVKLVSALQRLVDRGDTVVLIEHNADAMAAANCIIDLGPDGGERRRIVPPVARIAHRYTLSLGVSP